MRDRDISESLSKLPLQDGEVPILVIFVNENSEIGCRFPKEFLVHYRTRSAEGRAWMDGNLEKTFAELKRMLREATKQ